MGRDLFDVDPLGDDDYLDGIDDEELELQDDEELGIDYHEIRPIEESQSRNDVNPEDNALVSPEAEVYSPMMGGSAPSHKDLAQSSLMLPTKRHSRTRSFKTHGRTHTVGKLSNKMKHKHGVHAIVIHKKSGKKHI